MNETNKDYCAREDCSMESYSEKLGDKINFIFKIQVIDKSIAKMQHKI